MKPETLNLFLHPDNADKLAADFDPQAVEVSLAEQSLYEAHAAAALTKFQLITDACTKLVSHEKGIIYSPMSLGNRPVQYEQEQFTNELVYATPTVLYDWVTPQGPLNTQYSMFFFAPQAGYDPSKPPGITNLRYRRIGAYGIDTYSSITPKTIGKMLAFHVLMNCIAEQGTAVPIDQSTLEG